MKRLVILTEIIAPYRIPVFNVLSGYKDLKLHVIFLAETDPSLRQWAIYRDEIRFSYEVLPSWRKRIGRYNLLLNQNVAGALDRAAPDVIVCGGYNYLASWQALRWAKKRGVEFVLWCESTALDRRNQFPAIEAMKKRFLKNCDAFIVPGKSSWHYLHELGLPEDKIHTAPNAVDTDFFAERARVARANADSVRAELGLPTRYFLFAGRLVEEKGVFDLLEAYRRLPSDMRSEIGLVFAGDGPMRMRLEEMAGTIAPGDVRVVGFLQREDLARYYALAECLVFPTHSDPWGLVVNEAMACGLPVICSNVAGCAADLIKENGRVIAPGQLEQLTKSMFELAESSNLRCEMGANSMAASPEYSANTCAAGIVDAVLGAEVITNV